MTEAQASIDSRLTPMFLEAFGVNQRQLEIISAILNCEELKATFIEGGSDLTGTYFRQIEGELYSSQIGFRVATVHKYQMRKGVAELLKNLGLEPANLRNLQYNHGPQKPDLAGICLDAGHHLQNIHGRDLQVDHTIYIGFNGIITPTSATTRL